MEGGGYCHSASLRPDSRLVSHRDDENVDECHNDYMNLHCPFKLVTSLIDCCHMWLLNKNTNYTVSQQKLHQAARTNMCQRLHEIVEDLHAEAEVDPWNDIKNGHSMSAECVEGFHEENRCLPEDNRESPDPLSLPIGTTKCELVHWKDTTNEWDRKSQTCHFGIVPIVSGLCHWALIVLFTKNQQSVCIHCVRERHLHQRRELLVSARKCAHPFHLAQVTRKALSFYFDDNCFKCPKVC